MLLNSLIQTISYGLYAGEIALLCFATTSPTVAQIIPDTTLPVNSAVTPQGNTSIIEGGTRAGDNLFHSFESFSLPTGSAAFFNNASDIENIFSRVTGRSISQIDGLIRANGTANLFLLNPNGIIFGPNARLNIGGSFLASTASRLNFADGTFFSTTPPQITTPLLTVSVPIGLQLEPNLATIRVQGNGHNLTVPQASASPVNRENNLTGLRVQPNKTLALVGGDISIEGGSLTAESGRIELGSVRNGLVRLSFTPSTWTLNYENVSDFQDIHLSQKAALDASGDGNNAIAIQGRLVSVRDGSLILIQNQGLQPAGNININAAEFLEVIGTSPDAKIRSSLLNETIGPGKGGDIVVSTRRLLIQDGAQVNTKTFSAATGGNLILNASESIQSIGFSPLNISLISAAGTNTFSSGSPGNVTVSTKQLTILNGSVMGAAVFGTGSGGDVTINATESIELIGVEPAQFRPSALIAITFNAGNAGSLTINTSRLRIRDGGRVSAATFASGTAGSVTINTSESVEVSGTVPGSRNPSFVVSGAIIQDEAFQKLFQLPPIPSGTSGDLIINTPRLSVTDGALVTVKNDGPGNAGTLSINAGSIFLDKQGGITAATRSGEGGNIRLQVQDFLQMRRNSQISAEAGGTGNGGNLTINTPVMAALENSDISANAFQGRGGNISISTSGLFGTQFRPFKTSASDITASSQFGLAGVVEILTPNIDPSSGLVELPTEVLDTEHQITASCATRQENEFLITGRGGLPANPANTLNSYAPWEDFHLPAGSEQSGRVGDGEIGRRTNRQSPITYYPLPRQAIAERVEAQGWVVNSKGEVVLTAAPTVIPHHVGQSSQSCLPSLEK